MKFSPIIKRLKRYLIRVLLNFLTMIRCRLLMILRNFMFSSHVITNVNNHKNLFESYDNISGQIIISAKSTIYTVYYNNYIVIYSNIFIACTIKAKLAIRLLLHVQLKLNLMFRRFLFSPLLLEFSW